MAKFDLSLIRGRLKAEDDAEVQLGSEVEVVDVTKADNFVAMPDWFQKLTSVPGVPFGFVCEFHGRPDSGKTSAGMQALLQAQKQDVIPILVDAERKFSMTRFAKMGGDPDQLIVIKEKTIEHSFDKLEKTLKKINDEFPGAKILVLYDSIAVGVSQAEMEKSALDSATVADQARVIKRMVRRQLYLIQECQVAFIVINQVYAQINNPAQKASGGQGLEYAKALALQFTGKGDLQCTRGGENVKYGIATRVRVIKNHLMQGDFTVRELELECGSIGIDYKIPEPPMVKKKKPAEEVAAAVNATP